MDAIEQFKDAMRSHGINPPDVIEPDYMHRFSANGKSGDKAGWCKLFPDGEGGVFGDFRSGLSEIWQARREKPFTLAEREAFRRRCEQERQEREAEDAKRKRDAREKAATIWDSSTPASDDHPYLTRKGVKAHGLRVHEGALVIPMRDGEELHSLQFITGDGDKRFLPGGRVSGCYYPIGTPHGALCICEGYATGASIHEATGYAVAVAFNAGNLKAVARALRAKYPEVKLILCADDDYRTEGNPGLTKAREAAQAVGGFLAGPDFGEDRPEGATDFNDMVRHRGLEAGGRAVEGAKAPEGGKARGDSTDSTDSTKGGGTGWQAAVERLAKLPTGEYECVREEEAKTLGWRVTALDKEVAKARGETTEETSGQGQQFTITEPEQWPEPVNGAALLNELAATFRQFVVLPEHGDTIAALWTLHTYAFAYGHITPILAVVSPDKGCGKTTLRDTVAALARATLSTDGISASALFRVIEKWRPTVLLDDFDSWGRDNDELRGVLNTGYRKGGVYIRCVGDDQEPRGFVTFAPKCINLIGKMHPTLHDRSITITMHRKLRGERVESLHGFDGEEFKQKCARWVVDNADAIEAARPDMTLLLNRQADNWRPLLALATVAGGEWPARAAAAVAAALDGNDDAESFGVMLLADIRDHFNQRQADVLFSEDIVTYLNELEDRPWAQWGKLQKPITKNQVARLLGQFSIKSGTRRQGEEIFKGYCLGSFEDAFARYLPPLQNVTTLQPSSGAAFGAFGNVTPKNLVTDRKPPEPASGLRCNVVTDQNPPSWKMRI